MCKMKKSLPAAVNRIGIVAKSTGCGYINIVARILYSPRAMQVTIYPAARDNTLKELE